MWVQGVNIAKVYKQKLYSVHVTSDWHLSAPETPLSVIKKDWQDIVRAEGGDGEEGHNQLHVPLRSLLLNGKTCQAMLSLATVPLQHTAHSTNSNLQIEDTQIYRGHKDHSTKDYSNHAACTAQACWVTRFCTCCDTVSLSCGDWWRGEWAGLAVDLHGLCPVGRTPPTRITEYKKIWPSRYISC